MASEFETVRGETKKLFLGFLKHGYYQFYNLKLTK